jgi:mono/diheme cytochrome c family protein
LYVFRAYCVGCHGENGRGDGPMASKLFRDFMIRPTDLAAPAFQESHDDARLAQAIRGGGKAVHKTPYMPGWTGTLTDRQVTDLVAFVRELKPRAVEVSASMLSVGDQLELGRTLYTIRCLACHGSDGRGDGPFLEGLTKGGSTLAVLPDFSNYGTLRERSDKDLENVLFTGISHSGLLPESEPGWWDRALEKNEMRALIFYLRALPIQPEKGKV